jgi:hypothetical protein
LLLYWSVCMKGTRTEMYQNLLLVYFSSSKVKVKLSLSIALRHMGSSSTAPLFLQLGTRWRWVANCVPQPPPPWGKTPWYPLLPNKKLCFPHSQCGCSGDKKDIVPLPGVEPWISQSRVSSLYWLSCWVPVLGHTLS